MKLNFYTDAGHGWLEVERKALETLGLLPMVSRYSYENGDKVYLEEDLDAGLFLSALKGLGSLYPVDFNEIYEEQSKVRSFNRFSN